MFLTSSQAVDKKEGAYLSEMAKEQYSSVKYNDLKLAPKRFKNKKLNMELTFMGSPSDISSFYESRMPVKRYLYLKVEDQYDEGEVPVIISRRSRKNVITKLLETDNGSTVTVYGKIKKIARKRRDLYRSYNDNPYYFKVDDLDSGSVIDIKNQAASGKKPGDFEESNYKKVKAKNLDLLANKYIGEKITFTYRYQGRDSEITFYLRELFRDDQYIQLQTMNYINDRFSNDTENRILAGFALIGKKDNMDMVNTLLELERGDSINVYGTLNKYSNSRHGNGKIQYYILIDKLEPAKKNGKKDKQE